MKSLIGIPNVDIKKINRISQVQHLTLIKSAMTSNLKVRSFYLHMMKQSKSMNNVNLFLRCNYICKSYDLSLNGCVCDEHYVKRFETLLYSI